MPGAGGLDSRLVVIIFRAENKRPREGEQWDRQRGVLRPFGEVNAMLSRWFSDDLVQKMEQMQKEMNDFLQTFRPFSERAMPWASFGGVFPAINIYDNGEGYVARAELPGVDPKDVEVTVTGNTLNIKGKREIPDAGEKVAYHRRERAAGQFNRAFRLPDAVDSAKVEARFTNGILEVMLPKAEQAKQRKVQIKTE